MIEYLNSKEFFLKEIDPNKNTNEILGSQKDFNKLLNSLELSSKGDISRAELNMVEKIKDHILTISDYYKIADSSRLDFDIAKIFHENLKIPRFLVNKWGFWVWLSTNYFLEEIQWRWSKSFIDKNEDIKAAKAVQDHLLGRSKNHRIFPRRYWLLGERLHHLKNGYDLLDEISSNAKQNPKGGFGDYIQYLVDTKLLSFQDTVSKNIGKLLLAGGNVSGKDLVVKSFKRYNAFKNRFLAEADEDIFRKEICCLN